MENAFKFTATRVKKNGYRIKEKNNEFAGTTLYNHVKQWTIKWTIWHHQETLNFIFNFFLSFQQAVNRYLNCYVRQSEIFAWKMRSVCNKFLCSMVVGELWILTSFNVIICLQRLRFDSQLHKHTIHKLILTIRIMVYDVKFEVIYYFIL